MFTMYHVLSLSIGLHLNTRLTWHTHVSEITKKISRAVGITVGAKEIFTLLKRREKITAKQSIKFHIPLSLLSVGRV